MHRPLTTVPVGPTDRAGTDRLLAALRPALDGSGPAVRPSSLARDGVGPEVPAPVAVVLATSGSTGRAREVMLDRDALTASATATHERLGGPGRWLLALPLDHVAGLQVLVRSVVAGRDPVVLDAAGTFTARRLADLVRGAGPGPLYTSLVPTQLHRVLSEAGERLPGPLRPLLDLDAILVGGAATTPEQLTRARDLGLRVVTTYGMTETCGGCVYDGAPLRGVDLRLVDGRVEVAGPVLARGHLGRPDLDAEVFTVEDGRRWLRTRDLGRLVDGHLEVLGRADDVLVTGGVNVAPAAVERVLADLGVAPACVVGLPDPEWGHVVTAVVAAPAAALPPLDDVRRAVRRTLGAAAAPRHLLAVDELPLRGPGKVDRAAVTRYAQEVLRRHDHGGAEGRARGPQDRRTEDDGQHR